MTVFDDWFAAAGFPALLGQFGETITYSPYKGSQRTISAIVNRDPAGVLDVTGNAVFPKATLRVYNDSTTGIASSEFDSGKDTVQFYLNIGDSETQRFSMMPLQSQDAGVTHVAVI